MATLKKIRECLSIIKSKLGDKINKIEQSSSNSGIKDKLENFRSLKNIFEGVGVRKYYTDEMFRDFCEEFDILNIPANEAEELFSEFLKTKNLKELRGGDSVNYDDVVELYKEFLSNVSFKEFLPMLERNKDSITSLIDLDNTREILQFFKDKGILDKFNLLALLKITIHGKANYIKNVIYENVMSKPEDDIELFFEYALTSVWTRVEGTTSYVNAPFRRTKGTTSVERDDEISYPVGPTYKELYEGLDILRANSKMFDDRLDFEHGLSGLPLIAVTRPWALKKNISLCKIFNLGLLEPVPITCVGLSDIEDKINLAVELGLLNPPYNKAFNAIDDTIVKNEEFKVRNKIMRRYNHSIRNYYQRYMSKLSMRSINDFAYLFYLLQEEGYNSKGYSAFYNKFFSYNQAGKGNEEIFADLKTGRKKIDDIVSENFITDYSNSSTYIKDYDEYDNCISDYNYNDKFDNTKIKNYIDDSILEEPLIKKLEENNMVFDEYVINDEKKIIKNEFVYMFGGRIISRYKVLRNASILKNNYGYLNEDMLMASIVRNSFINEAVFKNIESSLKGERGKTL